MAGWVAVARWKLYIILFLLILLGSGLASRQETNIETIPPRTVVAGVEIGGLLRERAAERLALSLEPRLKTSVVFTLGERHWRATRAELGESLDIPRMISDAMKGDSQSEKRQWIGLALTVDQVRLREYLTKRIIPAVRTPGRNARLVDTDGKLTVMPGQPGASMDIGPAIARIAASPETDRVELSPIPEPPAVSEQDLAPITIRMAHYQSRFNPWVRGRTRNIRLATAKIEGILLEPGEIFSLNETVGQRTAARGYKKAHIFVRDEVIEELGGGMCQISSTLYNVVLLGDLEVVERHPHMFLVDYIPPGQDAAVAFGSKDFRFRNNTTSSIYLTLKAGKSTLIANLYGAAPPARQVRILSIHKRDKDRKTHAKVYREVLVNGEPVSREMLSHNSYPRQPKVTKPATPPQVKITPAVQTAPRTPATPVED